MSLSIYLSFYLFIIHLPIFYFSSPNYFPTKSGVLLLTDYTFDEAFDNYEFIVISAHSHECGACRVKIGPGFKKMATIEAKKYGIDTKKVKFALIEGSYNRDFMNRFGTYGYPSVYLVHKGKNLGEIPNRYETKDILAYIRKYTNGPIQNIENIDVLNLLKDYVPHSSLLVYNGNSQSEFNELIQITEKFPDITVSRLFSPHLEKELKLNDGSLVLYKPFDEGNITENRNNGEWNFNKIKRFIEKYNHKVILNLEDHLAQIIMRKKEKKILLYVNRNGEQLERFKNIAFKLRGDMQSMQIKYNISEYKKLVEQVKKDQKFNKHSDRFDELDPLSVEKNRRRVRAIKNKSIKFIRSILPKDNIDNIENKYDDELILIDFSESEPRSARIGFTENDEYIAKEWGEKNKTDKIKFENIEDYEEYFNDK